MCASDYRARAREMLSGKWGMAILITLIAGVLGGVVTSSGGSVNAELDEETLRNLPDFIITYLKIAVSIGSMLALVQFILGGTVRLGYCKYLLKLHDGEEGELKDLFSEFSRFGDGFVLSLLTAIYTFLWSLLFVIPGIIAGYKYAMAPYILAENPGMKPNEAITASKEMMDGHKFELFCLELSFIGWNLLCILTLGIGSLWISPYLNCAYAAFYRENSSFTYWPSGEDSFVSDRPQDPWNTGHHPDSDALPTQGRNNL